jgi:DNA (cytosine-5)-methyltransferase 1
VLRDAGVPYDVTATDLPGKPDITFPASRLAVFIDGDYWHGGQWKTRRLATLEEQFAKTSSRTYWVRKIRNNMRRDCTATNSLLVSGWNVLRFWESQIKTNLQDCVDSTIDVLTNGAQPSWISSLPQRTFLEFFAGIGLMRMGLDREGWTVAFANDIDHQKYEQYRGHFCDSDHYVVADIHGLQAKQVPSATMATACFPCNDLSLAGSRSGLSGKQSSAYWGFIHILTKMQERRPPLVLLENVVGLLNSHKGEDFREVLLALNGLGYSVDTFILDAIRFVPQSRPRLFVVGMLDSGEFDGTVKESLSFYGSDVRPKALAEYIFIHPEVRWNIRRLPPQPAHGPQLESILEDLDDDAPEWWSGKRAQYLLDQMSPKHREIAERMISGTSFTYGTVFRRMRNGRSMGELRTDGVAGCLRTPRGGSGRQILFKAGKGKYFARLVTPREAARLMGADDYKIEVPLNQALFGFGDAVCVPVVEWIARHYLNPLIGELIRGRPLTLST